MMSFRAVAKVAITSLSAWQAASAQSGKETTTPVSCNDAVTRRQYNERRAQLNDHEPIHAGGQSRAKLGARPRAEAKITVQSSEDKHYHQTASPALVETRLREPFPGHVDGESAARALQT